MELEEPTDPVDSDEDRRRGRPTGGAAISCSSTEVTRAVHNVRGLKLKLLPAPEPKSAHLSSLPRVQRRKPHRSNLHVDVCLLQLCVPRRPPIAIPGILRPAGTAVGVELRPVIILDHHRITLYCLKTLY